MKNYFLIIIYVLFAKISLANSGFYLGTNIGFLGQTNLSDITIKYLNSNADVSGVDTVDTALDNEIAFKVQMGYQKYLGEDVAFLGTLGYLNQSTVKNWGKRVQTGAMDASLGIQINAGENLRVKLGMNFPLVISYRLMMDDTTKAGLQGGNLKATGKLGGDIQLAYPFREYANFYFGYSLTGFEISEERNDTSGSSYKIRMDHFASHFTIGIDYVVGRFRRTKW